MIWRVGHVMS